MSTASSTDTLAFAADHLSPTKAEIVELADSSGSVRRRGRKDPDELNTFEITAYVTEALADSLEEIAQQRGISKSRLIRTLLGDFVESHSRIRTK